MKERQKELRRLAYIIHIMDNPDICLDLGEYFPLQEITKEKLEDACVEFDSIYPIPSNFTSSHMYEDSLRVVFDKVTRNIIETAFNGINGIKNMPYKTFLETLLSIKGPLNLTEEQFEFLYALKFDPDFISKIYKRRVKSIGMLYNKGISAITAIKGRDKRIAAIKHNINWYDDRISDKITESYTTHMARLDDLLANAKEVDSTISWKRRSNRLDQDIKEMMEEAEKIRKERFAQEELRRAYDEDQKYIRELSAIRNRFNEDNAKLIMSTIPEQFTTNTCINAMLTSAWVYWLRKICKIKEEHVTYATKYWDRAIRGCIILTENRLDIINHPEKDKILLPVTGGAVQLDWHMAVVSDFYLVECLHMCNMSITDFTNIKTNNCLENLAIKFRMNSRDIKSAQECLKNYCSKEFAYEFIVRFKSILEAPAIKINNFTERDVKLEWVRMQKKSTTVGASST